jgi:metal-sulfur cluster biosynthetic enzyme
MVAVEQEQATEAEEIEPGHDRRNGELSRERVLEVLRAVVDPELGVNIVDLGLVYGAEVEDGQVRITYTLTTMGCPIGPLIEAQMNEVLAREPGFKGADIEMVLRPPWTPELMSEEAKAALGFVQ